jgi:CsoR family transcriptional regulator, copper-sensing transcriptional repressor
MRLGQGEAEMAEGIVTGVGDEIERKNILNRLKRLEGQIRGLQSMVESGKGCEDVLTQVMAAKSALNQVGLRIISCSMKTCLAGSPERNSDELIDEALELFLKYVNCVK